MVAETSDPRGVGWAFPVHVEDPERVEGPERVGAIALARLDKSVQQSILLIVGTAKGERAMRPTFGCGIHDRVFAAADTTTAALIALDVQDALIDWEPRVEVLDVHVTAEPDEGNKLLVGLTYRVRTTNNVFNLVYPFYLGGGRA